jgi:8-oxo-dGTP diphosphatase
MTEYVAGFLLDGPRVALVVKNRPNWQKNKMNGIGGHVEEGENPADAMIREFQEETGYYTYHGEWDNFVTLEGPDYRVYFYFAEIVGSHLRLKTITDEEIVCVDIDSVTVENSIPNLTWLIPMAKSMGYDSAKHFTITEG